MIVTNLMSKLGFNSFNRKQLDIIDEYKNKKHTLYKNFIYSFLFSITINLLLEPYKYCNIVSISTSIISLILFLRYFLFTITFNKKLTSKLKEP